MVMPRTSTRESDGCQCSGRRLLRGSFEFPTTISIMRRTGINGPAQAGRRGWMLVELLVAMALLAFTVIPLAYSIASERRYAHALYQRSVAMEIVDGEAEALAAGYWRAFTNGTQPYPIDAAAATNLPPGRFLLTLKPGQARLEWRPSGRQHGGPVVREVVLR